jgi:hypothetical protein
VRPVAAFAGILDGRRLWLAVAEAPGSLALRATGSGAVITPENELPVDAQPGYLAARFDLDGLPDADETTYDVVLVSPGAGSPEPVGSAQLGDPRPGSAGWRLDRTDTGLLQARRETVDPAAELRAVTVTDEGLRLTVAGAGASLALLADGEPVVTLPFDGDSVVVAAAALPDVVPDKPTRVVVGEPGAWRPIRRRANDLLDPGRGAPLPTLADASARQRLRLRWTPRALLQARLFGPEGPG